MNEASGADGAAEQRAKDAGRVNVEVGDKNGPHRATAPDAPTADSGENAEVRLIARSRSWRAPVLVLLSLLSLALLPVLVDRRINELREEILLKIAPARGLIAETRAELAMEAAGTRGFLLTGDEQFAADFARAHANRVRVQAQLFSLVGELGSRVTAAEAALEDTLHQADARLDALYNGRISRQQYLAEFDAQEQLYRAVTRAAGRLDDAIVSIATVDSADIRRTERIGTTLGVLLVLLALGAAGSVARLGEAYRSLALRLDERSRQQASLGRIARTLGEADRASDVVQTVADSAVDTTHACGAYVERLREFNAPSDADVVAAAGTSTPPIGSHITADHALSAALVRSHRTEILMDAMGTRLLPTITDTWQYLTSMAVPLTDHGRVLGALVLLREPDSERFTPAELAHAHALGDLASSPLRKLALLEALAESEERFRQIAENISEFIWLSDPRITTGYHYASSGYERIWGRTVQSLHEDPGSALRSVHPDDRERVKAVALSGALREGYYDIEYRVVRPDGEIRWVRGRGFPVKNERGEVYRVAGITEDITDRKQAEIERERLLASERAARAASEEARALAEQRRLEIERVTESRTRLIRGFTHDVKNPLGAADGSLEFLEAGLLGELNPKEMKCVRRVRGSIRTALDLIAHLLELERAQAGKLEIQREPIDVPTLVREVAEEFRAQAQRQRLTLAYDVTPRLPTIESDPARVRQILANLVSNAVKYTPAGGHVAVRAGVRLPEAPLHAGDWVALDVTDTGPGIPEEKKPLLFQEFTRFDPGAAHGTGIGLAISWRVARALGGDLRAESEPGVGSTFTLWLPVGAAAAA